MHTTTTSQRGYNPPELLHLLRTARQVIDQHLNDHGHCTDCGSTWPCQRAQLAENALSAL